MIHELLEMVFYSIEMGFSPFNSEIKNPMALAKTYNNSTIFFNFYIHPNFDKYLSSIMLRW
ncbi:hypothetical protein J2799_001933 [Chryseobacterium vietnamense]|nr:hypothetical protein [Chryseobacterium vietnamense]